MCSYSNCDRCLGLWWMAKPCLCICGGFVPGSEGEELQCLALLLLLNNQGRSNASSCLHCFGYNNNGTTYHCRRNGETAVSSSLVKWGREIGCLGACDGDCEQQLTVCSCEYGTTQRYFKHVIDSSPHLSSVKTLTIDGLAVVEKENLSEFLLFPISFAFVPVPVNQPTVSEIFLSYNHPFSSDTVQETFFLTVTFVVGSSSLVLASKCHILQVSN